MAPTSGAKNFRARLRRGHCKRVTLRASLRARHLRFSFVRVLDPARGTVRAAPRERGRAPDLARPEAARGARPGTSVPRAWVEDRSPAEDRKRTRAKRARAMTGLQATRATRAHLMPPAV